MTKREMPAALYAAAGASDLAYQRLRKLPQTATATVRAAGEAASTLRERVATTESRFNRQRLAGDVAKLRQSAQRGAEVAQQRAVTGYRRLVAHGEELMANRQASTVSAVAPAELTEAVPTDDEGAGTTSTTPSSTSPASS